jgi:predicted nucleic acid-binding protein
VIICDAGPLIVLLQIKKLSILKELFGTVKVPVAVYDEITVNEHEKAAFLKAEWLKPVKVKKDNDYKLLEELVDKGEAEAIILAKQQKLPLLADDAKARKYAALLNVEVMGTLGLLKLAKNRGVIPSVKVVIKDMLAEGYYIDGRLVAKLLLDVGES